jgi:hypothetical protein
MLIESLYSPFNRKLTMKEKWVGAYTNLLPHLGNTSTNRVEGAHAALKSILLHSGGGIDTAFDSIDKWYRKMVNSTFVSAVQL